MVKQMTMDWELVNLFVFAGGMLSNSEILHLTMVLLPPIVYIVCKSSDAFPHYKHSSASMLFYFLIFSFKLLYCNN